jgi:hypothetical protein
MPEITEKRQGTTSVVPKAQKMGNYIVDFTRNYL